MTEIPDPYRQFIATSKYARWLEEEGRRENWSESVARYVDFIDSRVEGAPIERIFHAIHDHEVMPSMRALMTAGPALERSNIAGFNCSFLPIDHPRSFDEGLYILMNGTGVGFSVEQKHVGKLPPVAESFERTNTTIVVADSKEGWARAFRELLALLWAGQIPEWDTSKVRPAGSRLKTFGGRASGPAPLEDLFAFSVALFQRAHGRRLTPLEAHDLMTKIASVVVVGGVRRSALISLSDLTDQQMALSKSGNWWEDNGQRALANNSAVYESKPDVSTFMGEWKTLIDSKSGERGIFNRQAAKDKAAENGRRDASFDFGTNPCAEILLRPYQFCNLTEVVVRPEDTLEDLLRKVETATLLGTYQSTLTDFKYLRKIWQKNTEEERLLGVSLTGIMGHPVLNGSSGYGLLGDWLTRMKQVAIDTNAAEADRLGIQRSAAITCVKPSGTVSQLVGVSSGIHPWHSDYYIRTVRGDRKDPLTQFLMDVGIPHEDEIHNPNDTVVFSFPQKAPEDAVTRDHLTAIEHLDLWLDYRRHWCEHNPSITVTVRDDEWVDVAAWVYEHFDECAGVSFLPHSEHIYKQAPYQEVDKETYDKAVEAMPKFFEWKDLGFYEKFDTTSGAQELACVAGSGACEVVDIAA